MSSQIVYLDAVYGDDGTGKRGYKDKPFQTMAAAASAAQAGDRIYYTPGSYDAGSAPSVASGVTWNGQSAQASGAGSKNGATVSVTEYGDIVHKTVLRLASTPVTVANTTGASFGGLKLYDFPEGRLYILGSVASLSFDWSATTIGATGSGDVSLGTTITADATLGGTDVDLGPSSAMTDPFVAGVGTATVVLASAAALDGTSTAKDLNINIIIDDADVADAASDVVLVTGTVTVTWINLGDI